MEASNVKEEQKKTWRRDEGVGTFCRFREISFYVYYYCALLLYESRLSARRDENKRIGSSRIEREEMVMESEDWRLEREPWARAHLTL
jgi:hypothetical protein